MSGFTLICAWCRTVISEGAPEISHGICQPCADKLRAEAGLPRKPKWRELFPIPVSNRTKMVLAYSRINGAEVRLVDRPIALPTNLDRKACHG